MDISNASFTIEYHPFSESSVMEKTKTVLSKVLPGCRVTTVPLEDSSENFRIVRGLDGRVLMERDLELSKAPLEMHELRDLIDLARKF